MSDPFASPAPSIKHVHVESSEEIVEEHQHVHFEQTTRTRTSSQHQTTQSQHVVDVAATLANATAFAVTNSRIPSAISLNGSYSGWSTPYSTPGSPMGSSVPLPLVFPPIAGTGANAQVRPASSAIALGGARESTLTKRAPPAPVTKSTLLPELLDIPSASPSTPNTKPDPTKTISLPISSKTPSRQPRVAKPWLSDRSRTHLFSRHRISRLLVYGMILLGLGLGGMQCYLTYRNVKFHRMDNAPLCLVLDENFDDPEQVWGPGGNGNGNAGGGGTFWREVDMSGAGNGQFEMTTANEKNSYVRDGFLYLLPTLTEEEIGRDNVFGQNGPYIYNITGCTFNDTATDDGFIIDPKDPSGQRKVFDYGSYYRACSATSNQTTGSIVNPVQSARVSTRINALAELNGNTSRPHGSLSSGRLSVRARLPTGDWLWPAIWLLPTNNTYGIWPRSGEIDMVEARGNDIHYTARGSNYVQGSLHWGPNAFLDAVGKSFSWWSRTRGDPSGRSFAADFHEYVLEWTEDWMRIYVDTRLHTLLEYRFDDKPFWNKGKKPNLWGDAVFRDPNSGALEVIEDPWGQVDGLGVTGDGSIVAGGTGRGDGKGKLPNGEEPKWNAPFDQDFYLIMNVAVGGTNGWFPDGQGDKPWLNGAQGAMRDFANTQGQWYESWPQGEELERRAMVVDHVKMWRHC
ncbi:hypothetical protein VKT23_008148 [Stygiomarasmius scandens]|uniref:GH16 domain-containing protein n=1 Tax=Marasmiellus scandens TaxID=2682957 RepID=A0ABR1JM29_9AGAR